MYVLRWEVVELWPGWGLEDIGRMPRKPRPLIANSEVSSHTSQLSWSFPTIRSFQRIYSPVGNIGDSWGLEE
jgi:hypothetical protein